MCTDYRKVAFEDAIEHHLLSQAGYQRADPRDFDREGAIDPTVFLAFVQESQPETWQSLEKLHGGALRRWFWMPCAKGWTARARPFCRLTWATTMGPGTRQIPTATARLTCGSRSGNGIRSSTSWRGLSTWRSRRSKSAGAGSRRKR
jgi:hypothetical protein